MIPLREMASDEPILLGWHLRQWVQVKAFADERHIVSGEALVAYVKRLEKTLKVHEAEQP